MRKSQPATGFDIACKWKKNYRGLTVDEAWFILTDLGSLPVAIDAYKQRMGIDINSGCTPYDGEWSVGSREWGGLELLTLTLSFRSNRKRYEEMFRDCKTGGYNLEGTSLKENRLINIILLVTLAYSSAVFQGTEIQKKQIQKYVSRQKELSKKYRRRSIFGVGIDGEQWVNYLARYSETVQELMKLTPNKRRFYQLGMRAATLMKSTS